MTSEADDDELRSAAEQLADHLNLLSFRVCLEPPAKDEPALGFVKK